MTVTGNTARRRRTEALASSSAAQLGALYRRLIREEVDRRELELRVDALEAELALTTWQRLTRAVRRLAGRPTP